MAGRPGSTITRGLVSMIETTCGRESCSAEISSGLWQAVVPRSPKAATMVPIRRISFPQGVGLPTRISDEEIISSCIVYQCGNFSPNFCPAPHGKKVTYLSPPSKPNSNLSRLFCLRRQFSTRLSLSHRRRDCHLAPSPELYRGPACWITVVFCVRLAPSPAATAASRQLTRRPGRAT